MRAFIFLIAFSSVSHLFGQSYDVLETLDKSKKCQVVSSGEGLYGLVYNKVVVEEIKYQEYETIYNQTNSNDIVIVFHTDSGSVCWNNQGKKLLEFTDAKILNVEWPNYLVAYKSNRNQALFNKDGKQIVPFGRYEFENFENGILVKRMKSDVWQQQAFYDTKGVEVLPFDGRQIEVLDEYSNILSVSEKEGYTLMLNKNLELPYNSSKLNDFTFAKNSEVSIGEYLAFLGNQKYDGIVMRPNDQGEVDYRELLPDTNKVEAKFLPLYRSIFRQLEKEETLLSEMEVELTTSTADIFVPFKVEKAHKPLLDFPITGITLQQAKTYCSWLNVINNEYETSDYTNGATYRLPTEEEWNTLAEQGLREQNKASGIPDSVNMKNCMLFVYKTNQKCANTPAYLKSSKGGGTVPVVSANLDMKGRYHVFGNVAEMIDSDKKAKGGSYAQPANAASVKKDIIYTGPQPWLGFRIIGSYRM